MIKAGWVLALVYFSWSVRVPAETLLIKGSNTFGEELGPALIQEYQRLHPATTIRLESKGSASGFAALLEGDAHIGASSRAPTEDELRLARSRAIELKANLIGYYGIAVVVHTANPIKSLTDKQIRDIYSGKITNWKTVGGPDLPIHLYMRDAVSGTHLGFKEMALMNEEYAESSKPLPSYGAIAAAVAADRSGIGYVGFHLTDHPGVHAVNINGIVPSALSVNEGMYLYARALRLYLNGKAESDAARRFVRYVQSRRGQEMLEQLGYVKRYEGRQWSPTAAW